jgi:hypothetical protein
MKNTVSRARGGRRGFLKDGLRALLFGGFVLTGVHLATRPRTAGDGGSACSGSGACESCGRLQSCGYPGAVRTRENRLSAPGEGGGTGYEAGHDGI